MLMPCQWYIWRYIFIIKASVTVCLCCQLLHSYSYNSKDFFLVSHFIQPPLSNPHQMKVLTCILIYIIHVHYIHNTDRMRYSDNTLLGISARLNTPVHSRTLTIDNTESSILIQGHGTLTEEDRGLGLINQRGTGSYNYTTQVYNFTYPCTISGGQDPLSIHHTYITLHTPVYVL